jgi:hypothetical protein
MRNRFCDSILTYANLLLRHLHYTGAEPIFGYFLDHRVAITDLTGRDHEVAINVMISSVKRYTP